MMSLFGLRTSDFGLRRVAAWPPRCAPRRRNQPRRNQPRHGLSLIEALMAIFIVSVGLLGVVSLFTIGHHDARGGAVADHAALVGREKLRDFRVRGMDDPGNWRLFDDSSVNIDATPGRSFCIDSPFVIADPGTSFPAAGVVQMQRIKLTSGIAGQRMTAYQADEIFRSQDDLSFTVPDDADLLPVQIFTGASADAKRMSDGRYSWMATVVPQLDELPQFDPAGVRIPISDQYTLSIVVFYQRPRIAPGSVTAADFERTVKIALPGGGYGGGDATLSTTAANASLLNDLGSGQWIIAGRAVPLPAGGTQNYFQWYRLASVSDVYADTNNANAHRDVTLVGADWDTTALRQPDEATIVTGVVAVYEQTIRLKTSSLWLD